MLDGIVAFGGIRVLLERYSLFPPLWVNFQPSTFNFQFSIFNLKLTLGGISKSTRLGGD